MRRLWDLFRTFFKIGLFTFGGGYAMLSLIENECVDKKAWITHDEMMNITVIAESTPGPVAINCATYVGLKQKGIPGAVTATVGVVIPSVAVILALSLFLDRILEITWVAGMFRGIRIAVGLLILDAAIKMIRKTEKKPYPMIVLICACVAAMLINFFALHVSTIVLMLAAAVVGLLVFLAKRRVEQEANDDPS